MIFACSSFQPFHTEADVDAWCARHDLPRGAVLTMPALWAFASDWYGKHLDQPWRKRSLEEVRALFARHGLTDEFWKTEDPGVRSNAAPGVFGSPAIRSGVS